MGTYLRVFSESCLMNTHGSPMDFKTKKNFFSMLTYFLTFITAILHEAILVVKSRQECLSSRRNIFILGVGRAEKTLG